VKFLQTFMEFLDEGNLLRFMGIILSRLVVLKLRMYIPQAMKMFYFSLK
jgi:hypothetical protein